MSTGSPDSSELNFADLKLAKYIRSTLTGLVNDHGFELPITVAMVARNGAWMLATYKGRIRPTIEHAQGDSFPPPLNLMFVDFRGLAALLVTANRI